MKYKTKNFLKKLGIVVLSVASLVGIGSLVNKVVGENVADDDGLVKVNPTFSVGGLDAYGNYIDDDSTIYTKEAFECKGLEIELEFDKTINYEVFYYDELGTFLESSNLQVGNLEANVPEEATHCRIEIAPDWVALDVVEIDKQVVKWYEVSKYSKQMTIKVWENQSEILSVVVTHQAGNLTIKYQEDMTWGEWFESPLNTDEKWSITKEGYLTYSDQDDYYLVDDDDVQILKSEKILDTFSYSLSTI